MSGSTYSKTEAQRQLDESNKGHQILCKMGWSGAGLGAKEQGIEQPISGGEVRDRTDMYKGVGINLNDPYENFRKSKGQAFINRMKARAEESKGKSWKDLEKDQYILLSFGVWKWEEGQPFVRALHVCCWEPDREYTREKEKPLFTILDGHKHPPGNGPDRDAKFVV
uniref:G-patch domain-containing protein n=1 Tax=Timema shepardi TaxID=629360 RepID=A0A7R9G0Q2_TIMSH|nr:unnamed protein product [Timema shepardi]